MIAEATGNGSRQIISAALSGGAAAAQTSNITATAAGSMGGAATAVGPASFGSLTFQQIRNFGGIFMYMTSKWALACFALVSVELCGCPLGWSSTQLSSDSVGRL